MQIKVYNGKSEPAKENETVFYIQSKGNYSGRPLKEPIPNCWELEKAIHDNRIINLHYLQMRKIEENILHQEKIKSILYELKKTLSNEVCKKLSIEI